MTLTHSWIGVDTHGTSSAYIAADSRISWMHKITFDHGRRVFAFQNSPDILGYCGDVLFPTMVLSQITEMASQEIYYSQKKLPAKRSLRPLRKSLCNNSTNIRGRLRILLLHCYKCCIFQEVPLTT